MHRTLSPHRFGGRALASGTRMLSTAPGRTVKGTPRGRVGRRSAPSEERP